jgi:hypothetical protein
VVGAAFAGRWWADLGSPGFAHARLVALTEVEQVVQATRDQPVGRVKLSTTPTAAHREVHVVEGQRVTASARW